MNAPAEHPIVVDEFPALRRSLRVSIVTETYPPEVNGVARTLACVVEGLRERNHEIQLIRPNQSKAETRGEQASDDVLFHEVLMRGLPIPRYPHLRMGLTSKKTLVSLWARRRPDVVHIATEGPMGWSALQAAVQLKLPAGSQSGKKLRLKGRGLPGTTPGDQLVELRVVAPPAENDEQRVVYEEMAQKFAGFKPRG